MANGKDKVGLLTRALAYILPFAFVFLLWYNPLGIFDEFRTVERTPIDQGWQYERLSDPSMPAGEMAVVAALDRIQLKGGPSQGYQVILVVRKYDGHPFEAFVYMPGGGEFHCPVDDCDLNVRFDEGPTEAFRGLLVSDNEKDVVRIQNGMEFVQRLRQTRLLTIKPPSRASWNDILHFKVHDLAMDPKS